MGSEGDGKIDCQAFVKYFDNVLETDEADFEKSVMQFMAVQNSVEVTRVEERLVSGG